MTTRRQFAIDLLTTAGWSESTEKIDALVAQASKEDSGSQNNPLATTEPAPGATDYNSAGVKNYPSYAEGLSATLATLHNGRYPQLVGVLADPAGGSAVTYCTSAELNTWGTGNCLAYLEEIRNGDPQGYLTHEITGGGTGPTPGPPPVPSPPPPTGDDEMISSFIDGSQKHVFVVIDVNTGKVRHYWQDAASATPSQWYSETIG